MGRARRAADRRGADGRRRAQQSCAAGEGDRRGGALGADHARRSQAAEPPEAAEAGAHGEGDRGCGEEAGWRGGGSARRPKGSPRRCAPLGRRMRAVDAQKKKAKLQPYARSYIRNRVSAPAREEARASAGGQTRDRGGVGEAWSGGRRGEEEGGERGAEEGGERKEERGAEEGGERREERGAEGRRGGSGERRGEERTGGARVGGGGGRDADACEFVHRRRPHITDRRRDPRWASRGGSVFPPPAPPPPLASPSPSPLPRPAFSPSAPCPPRLGRARRLDRLRSPRPLGLSGVRPSALARVDA